MVNEHDEAVLRRQLEELVLGATEDQKEEENEEGMTAPTELEEEARFSSRPPVHCSFLLQYSAENRNNGAAIAENGKGD